MSAKPRKKLTSIVWRNMGEAAVLCLVVMSVVLYFLYTYGYFPLQQLWSNGMFIIHMLSILAISCAVGIGYGYWQASGLKKRLEQLQDSMLMLEKGNLSRDIPPMGEDEIGVLAEQLSNIGKRWEDQVNSLQRLSTHNAQLAEQAKISAITEERQRLARELHDAVSQQLFAISMTATALGRILEKDPQQSRRQVSLIEEMASVAQSEMRALLLHLRPVHLEGKRLAQGLTDLLNEMKQKMPLDIDCEIDEHIHLSKGVEDHLFRIAQEALSNTLRHAKASKLEIRLYERLDSIRLTIRDDGVGFELDKQKNLSYGLASMEERVNEIGGTIQIVTAPGKGTRIDIRVPIVNEEEETDVSGTTY